VRTEGTLILTFSRREKGPEGKERQS